MVDVNGKRRYWKLKEETLDDTVWRTHCRRGYGLVRQTTWWWWWWWWWRWWWWWWWWWTLPFSFKNHSHVRKKLQVPLNSDTKKTVTKNDPVNTSTYCSGYCSEHVTWRSIWTCTSCKPLLPCCGVSVITISRGCHTSRASCFRTSCSSRVKIDCKNTSALNLFCEHCDPSKKI